MTPSQVLDDYVELNSFCQELVDSGRVRVQHSDPTLVSETPRIAIYSEDVTFVCGSHTYVHTAEKGCRAGVVPPPRQDHIAVRNALLDSQSNEDLQAFWVEGLGRDTFDEAMNIYHTIIVPRLNP